MPGIAAPKSHPRWNSGRLDTPWRCLWAEEAPKLGNFPGTSSLSLEIVRGRSRRGSARVVVAVVPRWRRRAAGWVPALGADLPCVTGRKNPPGRDTQPQVTREGVKRPTAALCSPRTPQPGTPCWQRGARSRCRSSQEPDLKLSVSQTLSCLFPASGSADNTPPALFTGAKSTLFAAGGVSPAPPGPGVCPRPAGLCRAHRGHRSRLLPGYIHKTSPCRGLGRGIRLRSREQLSLLTPHPALGSSSDKPQPGLAVVIVPSRPYKGCWSQPV